MEPITSLQNDKVKLVRNLLMRTKTRQKERKIVLEGARLIEDAIKQGHKPHFVFYEIGKEGTATAASIITKLQSRDGEVIPVNKAVMAHMSDTQNPQGLIAVFPVPMPRLPRQAHRVLILDGVRDPGNLGTMLRAAAASGVQVVILAPGCVDPYNPKVLRGGMGAHFRVPVAEADWHEIASFCSEVTVYAASGAGQTSYTTVDWRAPWALVIGSEAHGVGYEAAALEMQLIRIPMAMQTESLNAAVAAGVILFEAARQRHPLDTSTG